MPQAGAALYDMSKVVVAVTSTPRSRSSTDMGPLRQHRDPGRAAGTPHCCRPRPSRCSPRRKRWEASILATSTPWPRGDVESTPRRLRSRARQVVHPRQGVRRERQPNEEIGRGDRHRIGAAAANPAQLSRTNMTGRLNRERGRRIQRWTLAEQYVVARPGPAI